jgi:AraC-like DNA-binding protein/mannose-6-phosphate isomerase-like protein (cupin superfamily)
MKDASMYEKAGINNQFPIQLVKNESSENIQVFSNHWHEQMEILYFVTGSAIIECNSIPYKVSAGDLIIINSNELHSGYNPGGNLAYFCFNIDPSLFQSSFVDSCEVKYIAPIERNMILFKNLVRGDVPIIECIETVIREHDKKDIAYELVIKSCVYNLLAILIRDYTTQIVTQAEYEKKLMKLERFRNVFDYIEENYTEKINMEDLYRMANLSGYYFCRLFKQITGKTANEYIINFRLNKAEHQLKNSDMNITEIALSTGFNDVNYFSRLFKKYKKITPSGVRKGYREENHGDIS